MQYSCLQKHDGQKADSIAGMILEEEHRLLKQKNCSYLACELLPEINPAKADWIKDMQFHVHFMETRNTIMEIVKQDNLNRFPVYQELRPYIESNISIKGKKETCPERTWKLSKRAIHAS
jgi:hypothetical protein